MSEKVVIIGAGLAGLATASALASQGVAVHLLESKDRSGGRAGSFHDPGSGQMIDACQHVSMGCCTNLAHFCKSFGASGWLAPQRKLFFMTPDRQVSTLSADPLPAPYHLSRSFLQAHYLSFREKLGLARALVELRMTDPEDDSPFQEWLDRRRQSPRCVQRFWNTILVSALNEDTERIGIKYARKVFVDGFMRHPRGFQVELPTVPLGQLYGQRLQDSLRKKGATLTFQTGVRKLILEEGKAAGVELRTGETIRASAVISAVPFDRFLSFLPEETVDRHAPFAGLRHLEFSPITSVHLWFDRGFCPWPHLVTLDCLGQWIFNRGEVAPGEHYLQVVVSASRQYRNLGHAEIQRRIEDEIGALFPASRSANRIRARVVTEHHATFSAVPGVDRWRPDQTTPIPNLFLAGDWTRTGWPATMEGAVRSGYLAAERLMRERGRPTRFLQPDL